MTRDDEHGAGLGSQPEVASQISPGLAIIQRIEHFLYDGSGRLQIQGVGVGQLDHVGNDLLHLSRHLGPPGGKLFIEFLGELSHKRTVACFSSPRKVWLSEIGHALEGFFFAHQVR
jgi:hypothetical protein